ncbi:YetF domain-containing protein [Metasolibacillus meyeri]|uniref:YetF domain-containing protein n=1 Tax=Metasolibacillus meyeri TaxID=1071052 RepID=UPI001EE71F85|nr:DUF421 domain-containing protein [Metasolibacillus meyeri]
MDLGEINFWEMMFRTTVTFIALLILARIIGKKQLSQLTFFHYTTGITFGSIAGEISSQKETPFWDGMISLIWWSILTILLSAIALRSSKVRVIVDDKPIILIQNGVISEKELKKARLHLDELMMLLREQSIFSINEVAYAIFETNGELSVMKKPSFTGATKKDTQANLTPPLCMPTGVISNGHIIHHNLRQLDLTEEWLLRKLRNKKIDAVEHVLFAQVLEDHSLYVSLKENA